MMKRRKRLDGKEVLFFVQYFLLFVVSPFVN